MNKLLRALACSLSLVSITTVVKADLNDGLVAYYPFDGNANDMSGDGHHGIENGGISYVSGQIGDAASFDGNNDGITISHSSIFNLSKFSISGWIKVEDTSSNQKIFFKDQSNNFNHDFQLYINDNSLIVQLQNGTNQESLISSSLTIGWSYITFTSNGINNNNLYINGILEDSNNISWTLNGNTLDWSFGRFSLESSYFEGDIDDIRIYSRALSESEIQELYQYSSNSCSVDSSSQINIDNAIEQGKQICIDNPSDCGINTTTELELPERDKVSLTLAPLVIGADIKFDSNNDLGVRVELASYSDPVDAIIDVDLFNASKQLINSHTYTGSQIVAETQGFEGGGNFTIDDGSKINQYKLIIEDKISDLNSNEISYARVFFKNKSACKAFGEESTVCTKYSSALIANTNNLGSNNSLDAGETRFINIGSSYSTVGSSNNAIIEEVTSKNGNNDEDRAYLKVWSENGKVYLNVVPITKAFELMIDHRGNWGITVNQGGYNQSDICLVDIAGRKINSNIFFTDQTLEITTCNRPEDTWVEDYVYMPFDSTKELTVLINPINGDYFTWDIN